MTAAAILMAAAACADGSAQTGEGYHAIGVTGAMNQAGIAFHKIDKKNICSNMVPTEKLLGGGILFGDKTVVDEDMASPFKPKSYLSVVLPHCKKTSAITEICGFSVESSFGIRLVSMTKSGGDFYFINDGNNLIHVKVGSDGAPYSFATKKLDFIFAGLISGSGITKNTEINKEYNILHQKYLSNRYKYNYLSLFAIHSSSDNNVFLYASKRNFKIFIEKNGKIKNTGWSASDLYNPVFKADGSVHSLGFTYNYDSSPDYIDRPFTTAFGLKENLIDKNYNISSNSIQFTRKLVDSNSYDYWKIGASRFKTMCENKIDNRPTYFEKDGFYFKRLAKAGGKVDKTILSFFGGPSGQFHNEHYGVINRKLIYSGYEVLIPYYGGSLGSGLSASARFRVSPLNSVRRDASAINRYLQDDQKVDIIAFSFGAVSAANFAAQNPDRVRKLIFVAPYVKHRDPSEYLQTEQSIAYQRAIENSWFGEERDLSRPNFASFLEKNYENLVNSGVEIHFIFGSEDQLSKYSDISIPLKKASASLKIIKADHQLVTAHPDTIEEVYNILGIQ